MDTRLTIRLNKDLLIRAKAYASVHKLSLTRMIEEYLQSII